MDRRHPEDGPEMRDATQNRFQVYRKPRSIIVRLAIGRLIRGIGVVYASGLSFADRSHRLRTALIPRTFVVATECPFLDSTASLPTRGRFMPCREPCPGCSWSAAVLLTHGVDAHVATPNVTSYNKRVSRLLWRWICRARPSALLRDFWEICQVRTPRI